jgi:type II secretory pathway component PulF
MLKDFRLWLARRHIDRRQRSRGVLEFLGTWLPVWCALALAVAVLLFLRTWLFEYAILLMIPVWVLGRYFIARRRADMVLQKIYSIIRLNHPLADALRLAGNSDQGAVGVRLQMVSELLQAGSSLTDSLRLAVPELKADDLAAIMEAERAGRLLPVLANLTSRNQEWKIPTEMDAGYLFYFLATTSLFLFAAFGCIRFILPKEQRALHHFRIAYSQGVFATLLSKAPVPLMSAAVVISVALTVIAAGALLRRLAIPFFRRGNVSIYIRDALAWRMPLLGSLIRCRAWSDGTRILAQGLSAGQPLPETAQSAAEAVGSRVARRRLQKWRENLLAGMSAESAARKCGLPGMVCGALAQSMGSTGSALALVAGYYDLKYRRRVELIHAISIPIAVLCMGTLVLLLSLALYMPYVALLQVVGGGAGT